MLVSAYPFSSSRTSPSLPSLLLIRRILGLALVFLRLLSGSILAVQCQSVLLLDLLQLLVFLLLALLVICLLLILNLVLNQVVESGNGADKTAEVDGHELIICLDAHCARKL